MFSKQFWRRDTSMSESKTVFEQFIKNSPNYNKLVFIHGERLFIFEDGQYKNLHVQLAWEVWQEKENLINQTKDVMVELFAANLALVANNEELQKQENRGIT